VYYGNRSSSKAKEGMRTINVIVADDHRIFLEGLKILLNSSPDYKFRIIGEAENGIDLMQIIQKATPDLLLLDLNMPGMDGLTVLKEAKYWLRNTKVIVLSMYEDPKVIRSSLKYGANGYLQKNCSKRDLNALLRSVLESNIFFGGGQPQVVSHKEDDLVPEVDFEDRFLKKYNLTKREFEILRLITKAMNNKQIAHELFISDQTVSVHRKNIMRKLGVNSAAALVKIAYDSSLI
jgi:DNA-binding NarL/FixJ family response regulator